MFQHTFYDDEKRIVYEIQQNQLSSVRNVAKLIYNIYKGYEVPRLEPGKRVTLQIIQNYAKTFLKNIWKKKVIKNLSISLDEYLPLALDEIKSIWDKKSRSKSKQPLKLRHFVNIEEQEKEKEKAVQRQNVKLEKQKILKQIRDKFEKLTKSQKKKLLEERQKNRPSVDIHIYELQRRKAEKIDQFYKEFMEQWNFSNPDNDECKLSKSKRKSLKCVEDSKLKSHNYQSEIGYRIRHIHALGLFWAVGTGKSLGSVLAAECALQQSNKKHKVVVITKKTLIYNFKLTLLYYLFGKPLPSNIEVPKDVHKLVKEYFPNYYFYGFEEAALQYENPKKRDEIMKICKNAIIVIDEVHELRALIRPGAENKATEGKRAHSIMMLTKEASKLIVLTGTPLVNYISDIYNLGEMFNQSDTKKLQRYKSAFPTGDFLNAYPHLSDFQKQVLNDTFKCKVSYIDPKSKREGFPESKEVNVLIQMDKKYLKKYLDIESEQTGGKDVTTANYKKILFGYLSGKDEKSAFLFPLRSAVNKMEGMPSPKLDFILERVKFNMSQKPKRTMTIHSSLIMSGLDTLTSALDQLNVKYSLITGSTTSKNREQAIEDFNKRKLDVLLISKAGATGIDLRGASEHINMETHWNTALKEQANARVIRQYSHHNLPKGIPAFVTVYNLFLAKPDDMETYETKMTDDAKHKRPGAPNEVLVVKPIGKNKISISKSLLESGQKGKKSIKKTKIFTSPIRSKK